MSGRGDRRVVTPAGSSSSSPGSGARVGAPVRAPWGGPTEKFDDLVDVDAPRSRPGVLTRGADGVIRPVEPWGDQVRVRAGPPTDTADVPAGAVHVDVTTGRTYRYRRTDT